MNRTAGLDLLRVVRQRDGTIPFIIYCSPEAVSAYKQTALADGANGVTASPTELLKELRLVDGGAGTALSAERQSD